MPSKNKKYKACIAEKSIIPILHPVLIESRIGNGLEKFNEYLQRTTAKTLKSNPKKSRKISIPKLLLLLFFTKTSKLQDLLFLSHHFPTRFINHLTATIRTERLYHAFPHFLATKPHRFIFIRSWRQSAYI